ncbi:putative Sad1 / UNC-like C-terminal [Blattamonas nauphoetae]|uniref:Sad1 / UNC-like C-terminal n=1 Tax=Blattamonas nauphoetae TaxID=2049346 RepID=A0ABQ9Y6Y1_9EUKA|nr:putative Sad1 / UNC-like C-terminal [Blattamonas nauphoetae]
MSRQRKTNRASDKNLANETPSATDRSVGERRTSRHRASSQIASEDPDLISPVQQRSSMVREVDDTTSAQISSTPLRSVTSETEETAKKPGFFQRCFKKKSKSQQDKNATDSEVESNQVTTDTEASSNTENKKKQSKRAKKLDSEKSWADNLFTIFLYVSIIALGFAVAFVVSVVFYYPEDFDEEIIDDNGTVVTDHTAKLQKALKKLQNAQDQKDKEIRDIQGQIATLKNKINSMEFDDQRRQEAERRVKELEEALSLLDDVSTTNDVSKRQPVASSSYPFVTSNYPNIAVISAGAEIAECSEIFDHKLIVKEEMVWECIPDPEATVVPDESTQTEIPETSTEPQNLEPSKELSDLIEQPPMTNAEVQNDLENEQSQPISEPDTIVEPVTEPISEPEVEHHTQEEQCNGKRVLRPRRVLKSKTVLNKMISSSRKAKNAQKAEVVLDPSLSLGSCLPLSLHSPTSTHPFITIDLHRTLPLKSISISHAPSNQALPTTYLSAPQDFDVFCEESVNQAVPHTTESQSAPLYRKTLLGRGQYKYDESTPSNTTQTFPLDKPLEGQNGTVCSRVRVEFTSNHGDPDFICVYNIQVHPAV